MNIFRTFRVFSINIGLSDYILCCLSSKFTAISIIINIYLQYIPRENGNNEIITIGKIETIRQRLETIIGSILYLYGPANYLPNILHLWVDENFSILFFEKQKLVLLF